MSKFQRADESVTEMASHILREFETHLPLLDAEVKIDFVFAFPDYDETTGEPINDALKHHGIKALGICRKLPLKDRALGRGDAEISIDGHWWEVIPAISGQKYWPARSSDRGEVAARSVRSAVLTH